MMSAAVSIGQSRQPRQARSKKEIIRLISRKSYLGNIIANDFFFDLACLDRLDGPTETAGCRLTATR